MRLNIACMLALFAWCAPLPVLSQDATEEERKGGYGEGRLYFNNATMRWSNYLELYLRSDLWVSGGERVGLFAWARANNDWAPHSALVLGLSYAPIPFIGAELGGGIDGNPLEKLYYLRGRLWLGNDLTALTGRRHFYYLDCVIEAGENGIYRWEARLKIRVTQWLGCGVYGEDAKGIGPRIDFQPSIFPVSVSLMTLVGRWDSQRTLRSQDVMTAIFVRLIL